MYRNKIHLKKVILSSLSGEIDFNEAHKIVEKFKAGIDRLKPGFAVITDNTEWWIGTSRSL